LDATKDLKQDHLTLRRVRDIAQKCSDKLYANDDIPFEDLEIISVVIEEFVDRFHHGKEHQAYFPETRDKDSFSEDVRKFLIEHEFGRRIARIFFAKFKNMERAWRNRFERTGSKIPKIPMRYL